MQSDARLIEIETRLAFQEQALAELGDVVHRQYRELEALRTALANAQADLQAMRDNAPGTPLPEPPPPHY